MRCDEMEDVAPPQSYNDFLRVTGLEEWPTPLSVALTFDLPGGWPRNSKDVAVKLRELVPFELSALDECDATRQRLEDKVSYLSSFLFDEERRYSKVKMGEFYLPDETFLTRVRESDVVKTRAGANAAHGNLSEEEASLNERRKDVTYQSYPGFIEKELNELPNRLEMPVLIDKIQKVISIPKRLREFYRTIYNSQASVALAIDGFWLILLEYFDSSSGGRHDADKARLFDRLADSFSALLISLNVDLKDAFLDSYAAVLSQIIYLAFAEAFPISQRRLDDKFKQFLCDQIFKWVYGVKAPIGCFRRWNVDEAISVKSKYAEIKKKKKFDVNELERLIALTEGSSSVDDINSKDNGLARRDTDQTMGGEAAATSHVVGKGDRFEMVHFKLMGNSQLVSHYLRRHKITPAKSRQILRQQKSVDATAKQDGDDRRETYAEYVARKTRDLRKAERRIAAINEATADEIKTIRERCFQQTLAINKQIRHIITGKLTKAERAAMLDTMEGGRAAAAAGNTIATEKAQLTLSEIQNRSKTNFDDVFDEFKIGDNDIAF